jgi:small subunit ribosomal protein S5e
MAEVEEPTVEVAAEEEVEEEEEEEVPVPADDEFVPEISGATEIKLFGKWAFDDIEVRDISLVVRSIFFLSTNVVVVL